MDIEIGDYVTRSSYNNDTVFLVIDFKDDIYYLKGVDIRLYADSDGDDLVKVDPLHKDEEFVVRAIEDIKLERSEFFYLPAKVLHIDGDSDYLKRCLKFYEDANIMAIGKTLREDYMSREINNLLKEYKPDVLIITGHDAFFKRTGDLDNLDSYKNSSNFVKAVKKAREYEKSHEKLVIIAGACQSNYEELIKAGANFASSPKRINIHALDPAIIATTVSLTSRNKEVDIIKLLDKTKYGSEGMGGLLCNGLMYVGYPR